MNEEADGCRECGGAFDRCRCGVEEAEKELAALKEKCGKLLILLSTLEEDPDSYFQRKMFFIDSEELRAELAELVK